MQTRQAISALAALAHRHRLAIFRLLVRTGPPGLPAGEIAAMVRISPTSASFHLKELDQAGLLQSSRSGRYVHYALQVDGIRDLLAYLTEDCCGNRPEICGGPRTDSCSPVPRRTPMVDNPFHVLFLCTHNSARSVMAECLINRLGAGGFVGHSAGSDPRDQIHPYARDLLHRENYEISHLRPRSWNEFATRDAPVMDFVFTVCDTARQETCPVWPGQPITAHWGLPDPTAVEGSEAERRHAFADAYRMLRQRIGIFVNLPFDSLDALARQREADKIGTI